MYCTNIFWGVDISQHRLCTLFYRLRAFWSEKRLWQFYARFHLWMMIANLRKPICLAEHVSTDAVNPVSWRFGGLFYDSWKAFEWRKRTGEATVIWDMAFKGLAMACTGKLKESGQKAAPEAPEAPEVRSLPLACATLCNLKVVLSSPILSHSFPFLPSDQYLTFCVKTPAVKPCSVYIIDLLCSVGSKVSAA